MRNPTKVTTATMRADSGSSRNASGTWRLPDTIQSKRTCSVARPSGAIPSSLQIAAAPAVNDPNIARQATHAEAVFLRRLPRKALTRNPTNGKSGTSASTICDLWPLAYALWPLACGLWPIDLPFERRERVRVEGLPLPHHRDYQRQADRSLRGGHRHHEKDDDLAVHRAEVPAEGDQGQVCRVQHDLDRQEDRDHIAAQEDPGRPDGEQRRGQDQIMVQQVVTRSSLLAARYSSLIT